MFACTLHLKQRHKRRDKKIPIKWKEKEFSGERKKVASKRGQIHLTKTAAGR